MENMKNNRYKRTKIRDRFQYWFDNKMTKSSFGLIRILIVFTFVFMALLAMIMIFSGILNPAEEEKALVNSITTVINSQTPEFSEKSSPGYIILLTLAAIIGVFFTSVLIGIVTNAIENKITELRKGNSLVIEEGHIVILGFVPGEYTLIEQLILSASNKNICIVIADDLDRDQMEDYIFNNVEIPRNVRIICRSADICDPISISKCSIETCKKSLSTFPYFYRTCFKDLSFFRRSENYKSCFSCNGTTAGKGTNGNWGKRPFIWW